MMMLSHPQQAFAASWQQCLQLQQLQQMLHQKALQQQIQPQQQVQTLPQTCGSASDESDVASNSSFGPSPPASPTGSTVPILPRRGSTATTCSTDTEGTGTHKYVNMPKKPRVLLFSIDTTLTLAMLRDIHYVVAQFGVIEKMVMFDRSPATNSSSVPGCCLKVQFATHEGADKAMGYLNGREMHNLRYYEGVPDLQLPSDTQDVMQGESYWAATTLSITVSVSEVLGGARDRNGKVFTPQNEVWASGVYDFDQHPLDFCWGSLVPRATEGALFPRGPLGSAASKQRYTTIPSPAAGCGVPSMEKGRTLFVKEQGYGDTLFSKEELFRLFSLYGEVVCVRKMLSKKAHGAHLVEFASCDDAETALKYLEGVAITEKKRLHVEMGQTPNARSWAKALSENIYLPDASVSRPAPSPGTPTTTLRATGLLPEYTVLSTTEDGLVASVDEDFLHYVCLTSNTYPPTSIFFDQTSPANEPVVYFVMSSVAQAVHLASRMAGLETPYGLVDVAFLSL